MKLEFKTMKVWEAFDAREWGSSWGYYTTKEEAEAAVKKNSTPHTLGEVAMKTIKVFSDEVVNKLEVNQGDILKLKGDSGDTYYVMVIDIRDKYNAIVLPDKECLTLDGAYFLDSGHSDYDTIESMVEEYQKAFKIEVVTMQQYIDEMSEDKSND